MYSKYCNSRGRYLNLFKVINILKARTRTTYRKRTLGPLLSNGHFLEHSSSIVQLQYSSNRNSNSNYISQINNTKHR